MRSEFTELHKGLPAKIFTSLAKAEEFTALLARLEISHRVKLHMPPKRMRLPLQTIVILLEVANGLRH